MKIKIVQCCTVICTLGNKHIFLLNIEYQYKDYFPLQTLTNKNLIFQIDSGAVWKQIYMDLGIPILNSAASYNVKTAYRK